MYQKIVCLKVLVRSAHGHGKGRTEALEGVSVTGMERGYVNSERGVERGEWR